MGPRGSKQRTSVSASSCRPTGTPSTNLRKLDVNELGFVFIKTSPNAAPDREGAPMIDARRLHSWLGPKWAFSRWMAHRISEYGFEEGADFLPEKVKTAGRPRTDYLLTLDTAKELAMVERTDIGRQTLRYFIEMKRAAVDIAAATNAISAHLGTQNLRLTPGRTPLP